MSHFSCNLRIIVLACLLSRFSLQAAEEDSKHSVIQNSGGLKLLVAPEEDDPALCIVLPGHEITDRSIRVLFPEHVTAVRHGSSNAQHLYLFRSGRQTGPPAWRRIGNSFKYRRDLPGDVHLLARATLEDDGVRFHYEFTNASAAAYDMIYAVTDPRLTGIFHDMRLERTYVHHTNGFDLLASDTPDRLTMPLNQWLPARYLASFTWAIPAQRSERRDDNVTYYTKSRAVDEPFIATVSTDHAWVIASFCRDCGNVWSNPELTCHHTDPQTALAPGGHAILERKMLILQGGLDAALERARQQRKSML